MTAMGWLAQLRRRAGEGWSAPPGTLPEGPLLDSRFLAQLEQLSLRVARMGTNGLAGEHRSRRQAHSVEFADYRDYRPGDDPRLIDWNVYARLGELTLRLTEATEAATLHLLLDCSGSMAWGAPSKSLTMRRLAAALGCIALNRYDSVSLGILHEGEVRCLPRLRGKNDIGRLLQSLDALVVGGALDLPAAVRQYCAVPRRGIGVLLSDLLSPTAVEAIPTLRRAGLQPAIVQVLDREEASPRLEGPFDLHDCETGARIATAITGEVLRAYAERFAAWGERIEAACRDHRATFVRLYTDQPVEDAVFGALRGGVLA